LNKRGLEAAPLMGAVMKKNNFQPDVIISSPAMRAKQTAESIKDTAQLDAEIEFDERIYEANPQALVKVVSEIDDANDLAMIVGHNPGLESLIKFLTGNLEPMPTAALAVIDLEIEKWSGINSSTGNLRILIRPKDEVRNER
jgi:phosphohistidine phosphatase